MPLPVDVAPSNVSQVPPPVVAPEGPPVAGATNVPAPVPRRKTDAFHNIYGLGMSTLMMSQLVSTANAPIEESARQK